jgi:hypothetical protein
VRLTCPWSCAQVNVPCFRAGGCTERCNPSTLSVGCSKTREPTRVTTRTPAVGYNPGWVDPPGTALMPVSQYGRPPLAFRQLGSHCRRQCRQVESLFRHGTASAESLPARHGRAPIPFFLPAMPAFHLTAICRLPARILVRQQYVEIINTHAGLVLSRTVSSWATQTLTQFLNHCSD